MVFTATILGTRCSTGICVGKGREGWGSFDIACIFSPTVTKAPFSVVSICISAATALGSVGIGAC